MNWWIFVVGLVTFALLIAGVALTFVAFNRDNRPEAGGTRRA